MARIKTSQVSTPRSSAGIMSFFDVSGGGPKVSPMVIVGVAIAFLVLEILINLL